MWRGRGEVRLNVRKATKCLLRADVREWQGLGRLPLFPGVEDQGWEAPRLLRSIPRQVESLGFPGPAKSWGAGEARPLHGWT